MQITRLEYVFILPAPFEREQDLPLKIILLARDIPETGFIKVRQRR